MSSLDRLIAEDALGQLRRRQGAMARLGSENGVPKLDWVDGVARLLAHDSWIDSVEQDAAEIVRRGIRHIIWSGMGGSVMTVRVLNDLGFLSGAGEDAVTIYPLDSTDPAAINAIVRDLADARGIRPADSMPSIPPGLLDDVLMIAVSMGMTSEEPITHLEWFLDLLEQAGHATAEHVMVMTLPGSFLDAFARERDVPLRALQLDGGSGTGGRMSAPSTRVFLLPVAITLAQAPSDEGRLKTVLERAWRWHDLAQAENHPGRHPFTALAANLSDASVSGVCGVLLSMPTGWHAVLPWVEQLMEESLGKGGKGIVIFEPQLTHLEPALLSRHVLVRLNVRDHGKHRDSAVEWRPNGLHLALPYLQSTNLVDRLAATAALFLGWQVTMALYGYLHEVTFAGQPAVEEYKSRARALRGDAASLETVVREGAPVSGGPLSLLSPSLQEKGDGTPAARFAAALHDARTHTTDPLRYLDVTINGELTADAEARIDRHVRRLGNDVLGIPIKLRRAPAAYHSTEQSEMDGPPGVVSLRLVARRYEPVLLGSYTDTFVKAQAVATWQAMVDQGRTCFLLVLDGSVATVPDLLDEFFQSVITYLP